MASVLTRRTLARAALALNAQAREGRHLPALILMTDSERLPDPRAAMSALPRGSAVILRHRDAKARAALAAALMPIAKLRDLIVLVADDPELAARIGADGLHCSEKRSNRISHWRARRKDWLVTAAAHSPDALRRAALAGAHAALLSPVFSTKSHAGGAALGPWRFRAMSQGARVPVYVLGGIDAQSAKRLAGAHAVGIAAIGALIPD